MCIHQSWVFPAPKGWDNKICVTEDVTAFGRAWIHPKDSATHIQGIQYTVRYFLCFSPRYVNLKICSIDMEIERRWRFLYFRLYNSVLLWQFVGNVLLRKKNYSGDITSKTLHFFHKTFSYSEILWCLNFCEKLCCALPAEGAEGLEQKGCLSFWLLQALYWNTFNSKHTLRSCHLSQLFWKTNKSFKHHLFT